MPKGNGAMYTRRYRLVPMGSGVVQRGGVAHKESHNPLRPSTEEVHRWSSGACSPAGSEANCRTHSTSHHFAFFGAQKASHTPPPGVVRQASLAAAQSIADMYKTNPTARCRRAARRYTKGVPLHIAQW